MLPSSLNIIYTGFRPINSYILHKHFAGTYFFKYLGLLRLKGENNNLE